MKSFSLFAAAVLLIGGAVTVVNQQRFADCGQPPTEAPPVDRYNVGSSIDVALEGPAEATSGGFAVVVTAPKDAVLRWRNSFPSQPIEFFDARGRAVLCFFQPAAGEYRFSLTAQVPADGLDPWGEASLVTVVGGSPPVVVVPPAPPNPPVPTPVPPQPPKPVVEGKRRLVLLYESADVTPAMGRLLVTLRTGDFARHLRDAGHTLEVLDDDSTDEHGKPSKYVAEWLAAIGDGKLPTLVIADDAKDEILGRLEVTDKTTAADVLAALKASGGK